VTVHGTKSNTQNIFAFLSTKRLPGWQDVQQRDLLLLLLFLSSFCFKKHEVWNKQRFLYVMSMFCQVRSKKHSKSRTHVHLYPQLQLIGKQTNGRSLTLKAATTSPGILTIRVTYVGLLMLRVILLASNFRSGAMMRRPHFETKEISGRFSLW
jgi:hypothetical protein